MKNNLQNINLLDSTFNQNEKLPNSFVVEFTEINNKQREGAVRITIDGVQIGDVIDDNSYEKDFYRYHDVFHYTFATMLDWSPCTRSMLKRKRKSIPIIDTYEDGARATITEEAISLMLFNEAKRKNLFKNKKVSKVLLKTIKQMTESFEVKVKTKTEWEKAIVKGYSLFRKLIANKGGKIEFNSIDRRVVFIG
ncbi:nucleotide pyrophosphohydrolase [Tenacibaculum finnmarkense]|uniref:Nucleotide pyrophosphohydrolase n=2 Tax=Tenacibaculum finnmarkense TaxID=2781243 RepID=A0AAP1RGJ9_9FLAO|nr:nucleotide pyrophosphohydrolase [Tenacibaculum finnmarkense]MBE7653359.1 nucleotide pyrophosphohydrolase [Tenacibaculum finnmarkense genomovar finnmarkense]MBE7695659.1 nucleotide pyrophosphohydrolase [Tenacibaculum finnmarkense genomovar finnmarkense]MCD8427680.1 nucleotide pyrophosphohydrolase [Tenacibaculum finnmarkense genomovar finnmarkense]MCG8731451.1 nucleotide pyrophosphohydrolase [Tenacibaculum finnmarkense]MCG8751648.1 nucleotide pyrophosphohydrolase [Tenacibaculum finnmarkense]